MAATTTLLGLVTPTQGTLSGTWGDTVNYGITDYVDISIAGTLSFAGDGAITLANTTGSASGNNIGSTTAQYMVIRITGTQTVTKVITGPSYSKLYMVDHAGATSAVTFKAAGQSGVSIAVGEKAFVYFNGTDYVKIATSTAGTGSVTSVAASVPSVFSIAGSPITTSGTLAMTYSGTALPTTSGGTGLTSFTSGCVVYASSSSALATNAGLQFDGTNLGVGVTPSAWTGFAPAIQLQNGVALSTYSATNLSYLSTNATYVSGGNWAFNLAASNYATRYSQQSGTHHWDVSSAAGTAGGVITFTQAMTLDASGNLGVGTTTPGAALELSRTSADVGFYMTRLSSGAASYRQSINGDGDIVFNMTSNKNMFFNTNNTTRATISAAGGFSVGTTADPGAGAIYATGNITAYYSSDIKFKENVRDIPDALATVNAIGGKLFDWKDDYIESKGGADGYFVQKADFGVVAQDVQKVFPIAVRTREDGSLAVDYEKLGALAFAALVELTKRVEALESK